MTRTHIAIPSGGRVDTEYLEDLSDQLADIVIPKNVSTRLQD